MDFLKMMWRKLVKRIPDYRVLDDEGQSYVEIATGQYAGCIYKYGKLELPEEGEKNLILSFDYAIIQSSPNRGLRGVNLDDDLSFKETIGDILVDIITSEATQVETRSIDTQEFIDE